MNRISRPALFCAFALCAALCAAPALAHAPAKAQETGKTLTDMGGHLRFDPRVGSPALPMALGGVRHE